MSPLALHADLQSYRLPAAWTKVQTAPVFPGVEVGCLHEVVGETESRGLGLTIGWITDDADSASGQCVWIGKRVWPGLATLHRATLLHRALLLDASASSLRAWAAELCVKCTAVGAVVVDGSGFDLTMTRRLQLAVRGRSCRLILVRPERQAGTSAAGCRWQIESVPALQDEQTGDPPRRPRWSVTLLKSKGGHRATGGLIGQAGDRPAGLLTAGEMFCHEDVKADRPSRAGATNQARSSAVGHAGSSWIFEWDPVTARARQTHTADQGDVAQGVPGVVPADVAGRSASATFAA